FSGLLIRHEKQSAQLTHSGFSFCVRIILLIWILSCSVAHADLESGVGANTITLYRIIRTPTATADDMRSYAESGIPLRRDDPESRRLACGISLFDSLERARRQAQRKPWLGNAYIARLEIPFGMFQIEKTGGSGHHTLWGDAHAILFVTN